MSSSNCCFLTCIQISPEADKLVCGLVRVQEFSYTSDDSVNCYNFSKAACWVVSNKSAVLGGWEGSLGEKGYMHLCGWVPLLSTLSQHLIGYESESVSKLCPTLCNPVDCSLPGSSVHGILQARILENPFPSGSSWPRDQTPISGIADRFFTIWPKSHFCFFNLLVVWSYVL